MGVESGRSVGMISACASIDKPCPQQPLVVEATRLRGVAKRDPLTIQLTPGLEAGARHDVAHYSSDNTGRICVLTVDGSSRSLIYNSVPFGRGTLSVKSTKPTGTGTV